jgi:hypothetical protein
MADILFVLVAAAFMGLCVLYVRALDRLVRAGDETPDTDRGVAQAPAEPLEVTR